jgi:hypothetical protein
MHPSRSYAYDEEQAPLSSYSTTAPRSHQASPNFPTTAQTLNRPPYDGLQASYYAQQQLHNNTSNTIHTREGAPYVSTQTSRYLSSPQYRDGQSHNVGYKPPPGHSYSGYLYQTPYTDSSQFPATGRFSVNQDMERRQFIPTPSEMARVYPSHTSSPRSIIPSHHSFESDTRHLLSRSSQPHLNPIPTTTTHVATHVPNATSSPTTTERYPCEKCGKTFSRCVG